MKTVATYLLMLLSWPLTAQSIKEGDLPAAVKAAFVKNFQGIKKVKLSKEKEGEFEAEFKNGNLEQSANFDASGKWLITETEINKKDLPSAIQSTLKKEFASYKIEEAEQVENPNEPITYEVMLEKGKETLSVVLSKDGKVLKKEEEKEEDD